MIEPALRLRVARGPAGTKKWHHRMRVYKYIEEGSIRTTRWARSRSPDYWVSVAIVSVERGFLVLRVYNWGRNYCPLHGVRYSGVFDVLKSMEKRLGLSELSVISWVSAVEGRPLSGVPLYSVHVHVVRLHSTVRL